MKYLEGWELARVLGRPTKATSSRSRPLPCLCSVHPIPHQLALVRARSPQPPSATAKSTPSRSVLVSHRRRPSPTETNRQKAAPRAAFPCRDHAEFETLISPDKLGPRHLTALAHTLPSNMAESSRSQCSPRSGTPFCGSVTPTKTVNGSNPFCFDVSKVMRVFPLE